MLPGFRLCTQCVYESARRFTDEQLKAEHDRRGLGLAEMSIETLLEALRIHGWEGIVIKKGLSPDSLDLVSEIADYLRNPGEPMVLVTQKERDEWKAREHMQQHLDVMRACKDAAYRSRNEMHEELMRLIDVLTPEQAQGLLEMYKNPVVYVDANRLPMKIPDLAGNIVSVVTPEDLGHVLASGKLPTMSQQWGELMHGDGSPRTLLPEPQPPDNLVAWLDEDLLAADIE